MVECGIPYSKILEGCNANGVDFSKVKHCLITHGHSDHCKAAKDLSSRNIKIYASKETLEIAKVKGVALAKEIPQKITEDIAVFPFEVEHDIDGAYGFIIKTSANETILFVNDCKRWTINLINFRPDYVFIECNYYHETVYAQIYQLKHDLESNQLNSAQEREAKIKIQQHERNLNSHMSLHGTLAGLSKLDLSLCKSIFLMHMSDRYANEYVMKNEVQTKFKIKTYACGKYGSIK